MDYSQTTKSITNLALKAKNSAKNGIRGVLPS